MSDTIPVSKSYNLGRVVGWSAYEEFLKEYSEVAPTLSEYVTEPVYIRAITFGVSAKRVLPLTEWEPLEKDHHQGEDPGPTTLFRKIIPCLGACWGCVPVVGLDYSGYTNPNQADDKWMAEKAISTIFACEVTDSEGNSVTASNRRGNHLTFYANPEIVDVMGLGTLPLIIRGLDVEALVDIQTVCWGPQGLLFGGNGLKGPRELETQLSREILKGSQSQELVSAPVIDFQSQDPETFYETSGTTIATGKKEIKVEDIKSPGEFVSMLATIPNRVIEDSRELTTPPAVYAAKLDIQSVNDGQTDVDVVPLDTAAPYHFRVLTKTNERERKGASALESYEKLYPENVVLLRDSLTRQTSPSYVFEQIVPHTNTDPARLIPVSDDTLFSFYNKVRVSNATYPMIIDYSNPDPIYYGIEGGQDIRPCLNQECSGCLSLEFAQEYAFDPFPNGYNPESPTSEDADFIYNLLNWVDAQNHRVNANLWNELDEYERANYRWFLTNPGKSYGNAEYWYLVPIEKKSGRFDFIDKRLSSEGLPSFTTIRSMRYGLAKEVEAGVFEVKSENTEDIRYYGDVDEETGQKINRMHLENFTSKNAAIGYVGFNSPDAYFFCTLDLTNPRYIKWDEDTNSWITTDPLNANDRAVIASYANRELLYESIRFPSLSPSFNYARNGTNYTFKAAIVSDDHKSESSKYVEVREWTAAEKARFKKAVLGLEDGIVTGGAGPIEEDIEPWKFFSAWWEPDTLEKREAEEANNSALKQYLSRKLGRTAVVIDGERHRPTLNLAAQRQLGLKNRADLWETAYVNFTLRDYYRIVCGLSWTDEEWDRIFPDLFPGGSRNIDGTMTLGQLAIKAFFYGVDEQDSGDRKIAYEFNFLNAAKARALMETSGNLAGVVNDDLLFLTGEIPQSKFMNTVLANIPERYQLPGGPQAAVGTSGLHETMALAITDAEGNILPMSGSAGDIPDPEEAAAVMWDDKLHWDNLVEALAENKSIDLLGEKLRAFKNLCLAGSGENYIEFKNGLRLYVSDTQPTDQDIPDGSIGLGW